MNTETTQTVADAEAAPPSLGLNDLGSMLTIIEVCSSRGAFKAEELAVVGGLYNKVKAFVQSHEPQPAAQSENPAEENNA